MSSYSNLLKHALAVIVAMVSVLSISSSTFAQGGGIGGFGGGQGGFGGLGGGGFGGLSGGAAGFAGTSSNRISYLGVRNGFRPSWVTATTTTRTGGQFGQLGGGQFGQLGGGLTGNILGRNQFGSTTIPHVTGAMVQETMKPLPPSVVEIQERIPKLLASASGATGKREVTFELDEDDVLVIRGDVPNLQERRLAESLLLLEPGVGKVRNELLVNGRPPPQAKPSPKPPMTNPDKPGG